LSAPAGGGELVVLKEFSELFLICVGFESQYLLKEINGISA
jgi:hypothetical protein